MKKIFGSIKTEDSSTKQGQKVKNNDKNKVKILSSTSSASRKKGESGAMVMFPSFLSIHLSILLI